MASTALFLLSLLPLIAGYSFEITAAPTQCGPLSIRIINGGGNPPYTALVVPFGPFSGSIDKRTVFQQNFTGTDVSFILPYPASSDFVVMVSDSNGIGTGGTSVPTSVSYSCDSSCLVTPHQPFFFWVGSDNAINQCETTTLNWSGDVQGNVNFLLLIPGGQSTPINAVNPGLGWAIGISWTPNIRVGMTILLVAGDSRGPGTGGRYNTAVGNGDSGCLDNFSPSSTAGTPAGAIQTSVDGTTTSPSSLTTSPSSLTTSPSSTAGTPAGAIPSPSGSSSNSIDNTSSSRGSGSNTGAVAGGVLGGLAAVVVVGLLAFFFIRRRRRQQHSVAHGVDLHSESALRSAGQPPGFYQPEPFVAPSSIAPIVGAEGNDGTSAGRQTMSDVGGRYSALSTVDLSESGYGTTTGTSGNMVGIGAGGDRSMSYGPSSRRRSTSGLPVSHPVNFLQHEDGGEVPEASGSDKVDEVVTVELPPRYKSVRRYVTSQLHTPP